MGREGHTACAGPAGPVPVLRAARDAADEIARAPDLRRVRRRSLCASGLALIEEQIELGRRPAERGQDHVRVAAMVGLIVALHLSNSGCHVQASRSGSAH